MENKHTPLPWKVVKTEKSKYRDEGYTIYGDTDGQGGIMFVGYLKSALKDLRTASTVEKRTPDEYAKLIALIHLLEYQIKDAEERDGI